MHDVVQDSALGQRVELILQQVDSLPTLSPIAIRILELAGSSETAIDEIVRLIESDPSLSVKLLTLCRRADRGLGAAVQTVERAVVLLGLDAVRAAVLSFEVFEAIESRTEEEEALASAAAESEQSSYKRKNLWRYLIAIACAAELLAERHQYEQHVNPEEAFLCGLLSGLGMLALDRVLPRSFAKAAAVAERKQRNIDAIEKQLLGMDHHTAGKRLAEHWKLPHVLQDCMWLVGQHPSALPELPHWHMVALVTAAAEIARSQHIGWSGNFTPSSDIHAIASAAGLDARGMDQTIRVLPERVADRAQLIGLDDVEDRELLLESVMAANKKLGRLAELFDERSRRAERHAKVIESISRFNAYSEPARSMASALARVSRSASELINADTIIGLVQTRPAASWHAYEFNAKGEALRPPKQLVHKDPSHVPDLEELIRPGVRHATHLGAITDQLSPTAQRAELQVVPMVAGWGPTVVLLMDADPHTALQHETLVHAVTSTWATTVAAASQQSGLRAVSEQLADSNRRLTDMQSRLVEAESLARLGELASGAAHEMNNPLTVITGKSQLLSSRIKEPENQKPLSEIVSAAHRLSALIDGLHFFASPPEARRTQVDLALLVERAAEAAHDRLGVGETMLSDDSSNFNAQETPIGITIDPVAEVIYADEESLAMALTEVMANAIEASPTTGVEVRAQVRVDGDRLEISVTDDGVGLTDHALHHACDPFFSDKEAGRQTGLGLAKARRIAEMHGGFVELARTPDGTRVSITLDAWRTGSQRPAQERAA